jgi:DNA (cytosine-5)-methyltransferase 1
MVGVDIIDQPMYPFRFIKADVRDLDADWLSNFDFAAASPPCQRYTAMRHAPNAKGDANPALIDPVRALFKTAGIPYAIENVPGAPLVDPVVLCGSHFGLGFGTWQLQRHRLFETSFSVAQPFCFHHGPVIGVYGGHIRCRSASHWRNGGADFPGFHKKSAALVAMGLPGDAQFTMDEISEGIPPVYAEWIGLAARQHILMLRRLAQRKEAAA